MVLVNRLRISNSFNNAIMKETKIDKGIEWNWWNEIKYITEELSYPIVTITILVVEVILAISYIVTIIIAVFMILSTLIKLF